MAKKKREHPNVAWFKRLKTLPQPTGKHAPMAIPLGAMIVLSIALAPAIGIFWSISLALCSGVVLAGVGRYGDSA